MELQHHVRQDLERIKSSSKPAFNDVSLENEFSELVRRYNRINLSNNDRPSKRVRTESTSTSPPFWGRYQAEVLNICSFLKQNDTNDIEDLHSVVRFVKLSIRNHTAT
jgi:hypothetical protein